MKKYPNLFKSIQLGQEVLKNRIICAPMSLAELSPEDHLTPENIAFYELRAKGGAAVVTLGESIVHAKTGKSHTKQIALDDELIIPSLTETAKAIKRHGCIPSIELSHGGKYANAANLTRTTSTGLPAYGPSHEIAPDGTEIMEMPEELILEIVEAYGKAAALAKYAGFEMVLLHAAHGWLPNQFMSPATNRRTDKYGGGFENRMRFTLMVLDSMRKALGQGFPIEFRMSGVEYIPGGYDLEEGIRIAQAVEDRVELIHVSAGNHESPESTIITHPTMFLEHGSNVHLAAAIKKAVNIPVACVGGLNDPQQMEDIIASGQADIVEMARALVAEPYLPKKANLGKDEEILKCIRCFNCLNGHVTTRTIQCTLNPVTGREFEHKFAFPPSSPKKVLIAGGGPAGMQAAITAAERGHQVMLCEKSDSLGGLLKCEEHVQFKKDLYDFIKYLVYKMSKLNVMVRLNTAVTKEFVEREEPDVLVCAIGAEPIIPDIEGIDHPKVISALKIPEDTSALGDSIVVLGGGLVGCETAIHLAQKGKKVCIVEMLADIANDANFFHKTGILVQIKNLSIEVRTSAKGFQINEKGIKVAHSDGTEALVEADSLVYAVGMRPLWDVVEQLRYAAPEFYQIGDCVHPRNVLEAVQGGYSAALDI